MAIKYTIINLTLKCLLNEVKSTSAVGDVDAVGAVGGDYHQIQRHL